MGESLAKFLGPCVGSAPNSLVPEDYFRSILTATAAGVLFAIPMIPYGDAPGVALYGFGVTLMMELFDRYRKGGLAP